MFAHPVCRSTGHPALSGIHIGGGACVPGIIECPFVAGDAFNGFVIHVKQHRAAQGLAVLVGEREGPVLGVSGREFVAERGGCDLQCLGFVRIDEFYGFTPGLVVVEGDELDHHVGAGFLGQANAEVVQTFVIVEPSLADDLVGRGCDIIDVGLGRGHADGDVAHIVLVDVLLQRRDPHRVVLDGRHLVFLAVDGDVALDIHFLFARLGIDDVYLEPVFARGQVGQVDGRVVGVQVAGLGGFLATIGDDLPGAPRRGVLLIGGVVFQRQFDGLVVEVGVFVHTAQFDATTGAHDERGGRFLGLTGIGGDGGSDHIVVACPVTAVAGAVLDEQLGVVGEREHALAVGDDGGVQQVLAAAVSVAPPPPTPSFLDKREAHGGIGNGHAAIGLGLAGYLDGLPSNITVPCIGEGDLKCRGLVLAHVHRLIGGMVASAECALHRDEEPAVHAVLGHDKRALDAAEFVSSGGNGIYRFPVLVAEDDFCFRVASRRTVVVRDGHNGGSPLHGFAGTVHTQVGVDFAVCALPVVVSHLAVINRECTLVVALGGKKQDAVKGTVFAFIDEGLREVNHTVGVGGAHGPFDRIACGSHKIGDIHPGERLAGFGIHGAHAVVAIEVTHGHQADVGHAQQVIIVYHLRTGCGCGLAVKIGCIQDIHAVGQGRQRHFGFFLERDEALHLNGVLPLKFQRADLGAVGLLIRYAVG